MTKDTTSKVLLTIRVKMLVAKFSVDEEKNTTTTIKQCLINIYFDEEENTTTTIKQCLINYLILILINLFWPRYRAGTSFWCWDSSSHVPPPTKKVGRGTWLRWFHQKSKPKLVFTLVFMLSLYFYLILYLNLSNNQFLLLRQSRDEPSPRGATGPPPIK